MLARAAASALVMAGASDSPWRRESTTDSRASTRLPSCKATVTAGVAVSKARISTVSQRSHLARVLRTSTVLARGDAPPEGPGSAFGWLRLDRRQQATSDGQRVELKLASRNRAEAVAVVGPQADRDQDVPVLQHHG